MYVLDGSGLAEALTLYRTHTKFFPLIGAVLEGLQPGTILCDHAGRPRQYYVEHAFGFAQIFGETAHGFERDLHRSILIARDRPVAKVRLYLPQPIDVFASCEAAALRAERQRFVLDPARKEAARPPPDRTVYRAANGDDLDEIEGTFGVVSRFWRSARDFLDRSRPTVAEHEGSIVSLCYAAAVSDGRAEIDVATVPDQRGSGHGGHTVALFVDRCARDGIEPLWDCFTNNVPSMRSAAGSGFVPSGPPYPILTVPQVAG